MNIVKSTRMKLRQISRVSNSGEFHDFFVQESIKGLFKSNPYKKFNTILALGANHVEARNLIKFPFKKIVLSGITPPNDEIVEIMNLDKRVEYKIETMEKLTFKDRSFDLIFVKEAIHHVSRPILAFYEMLRVSRNAVIFIEPRESFMGNVLDKLDLSSKYEENQTGNKRFRDNFVYRWRKKEVIKLLNSYYLKSGYKVNFTSCWMSNRLNNGSKVRLRFLNFIGWILSFLPNNEGNYLICTIYPGKDLPPKIN